MLNESQQKPKPRRQHSTHKNKTGWNKRCPNRNRKNGRKRRKNIINQHQERKKEDSTQGEYAYFRLARSAGEGVTPRRSSRITKSSTKETREAKIKAEKAIRETNGTTRQKYKTNEKRKNGKRKKEGEHRERQKEGDEKRKKKKKKEDSTQGEYAYFRLARSARGGVAPRRNNRMTESATKESTEAKVKAKKAIQESNGKRQHERTKTNEKETRNTTKRRGKKNEAS